MDHSRRPDSVSIKTQYSEEGYCAIPHFFSQEEVRALDKEIRSARERFPSRLSQSGLIFRQYLHFHSPFIQDFLSRPKVIELLKIVAGTDFWLRKDQAVLKHPGGIEFPWHQDNGYNGIHEEYHQFWIPLTNMSAENGALSVIPGSHRRGILPHKYNGNYFVWEGKDAQKALTIEAKPGDALLFSSLILHRSGPNNTRHERAAYVAEVMSSRHFDPDAKPPYFQIAVDGKSKPEFVRSNEGSRRFLNRTKYFIPRMFRGLSVLKRRAGMATQSFFPKAGS